MATKDSNRSVPRFGGPKYFPGVGVRGRFRRAFSMLRVRPSISSPCNPSFALSACSEVVMLTKPNPRDSFVCGSTMIEQFSTSPYFSKRRETSASDRRGWIPVTKRFVPGLAASSSSSSGGLKEASPAGALEQPRLDQSLKNRQPVDCLK